MDTLAARGLKPPPLRAPDVGGQAIRVGEARVYLDSLLAPRSVAPQRAAVRRARAELAGAREALRVAETAPNQAAVARAERALAEAQAAAQPAAISRQVGDVVSEQLEEAGRAAVSRRATRAQLPVPTGGRYRTRPPDVVASQRLLRRSRQLAAEAEAAEATLRATLRPAARQVRDEAKEFNRARAYSLGGTNLKGSLASLAKEMPEIGGVRNVADPVTRTAGRGGKAKSKRYWIDDGGKHIAGPFKTRAARDKEQEILEARLDKPLTPTSTGGVARSRDKTLDEITDDLVAQSARAAEQGRELTPLEREVLEEFDRISGLRGEATEIERAVRGRFAPEGSIEFGATERAAAVARFEELAGRLGPRVNAPARRARAAQPVGIPEVARNVPGGGSLRGFSAEGKRRFRAADWNSTRNRVRWRAVAAARQAHTTGAPLGGLPGGVGVCGERQPRGSARRQDHRSAVGDGVSGPMVCRGLHPRRPRDPSEERRGSGHSPRAGGQPDGVRRPGARSGAAMTAMQGSRRQWLSAEHAAVAAVLVKRELESVAQSITGRGLDGDERMDRMRELAHVLAALHGGLAR